MKPLRIGLIGCGRISDIYIENCKKFDRLELLACAAIDKQEASAKAQKWQIPQVCAVDELLTHPDRDCILNLTVPAAHAEISLKALSNNKHVYTEKPIAATYTDGLKILELAKEKGMLVGNAPDTFLGGRWQTVRHLIDTGIIGKPLTAFAFVGTHGVERHHPNPDFYYQKGGGPLLDLGPYYLTIMVFLFGSISQVAGKSTRGFASRMIENGSRNGEWMPVDIDTHVNALITFANKVEATMTMSFDIWDSETPRFEVYGELGTISIPDPDPVFGANRFGGEVLYRTRETSRWTHQPRPTGRENWQVADNPYSHNENARGLGLLDLALAVTEGRQPRASGELAAHISETMDGILCSATEGQFVDIVSAPARPQPLPVNFP